MLQSLTPEARKEWEKQFAGKTDDEIKADVAKGADRDGTVLNGPGGGYARTRTIAGQQVSVRLDGVHLNMAGSIYLANYIASYVSAILPPVAQNRGAAMAVGAQISNRGRTPTEAGRGLRIISRRPSSARGREGIVLSAPPGGGAK